MADVMCNDNRFEVIGKAKEHMLEATNIETSPDEMAALDSFLFRCWQMGWLDRYDDTADAIMPMTLENAIDFIDKIGWRAEHDRIMSTPQWIPCDERLPEDLEVVNITWINHRPMTYYADIKDKPFTATAIHYKDKWWWYSPICEDLLAECGKSECDKMDADIEVTAWMPLPEPYKEERRDDE